MREISKWLMHEDQKDLFELLLASTLNLLFLALIALLLWPLGSLMLAVRLAKGHGILWVVIFVTAVLVRRIQRLFRVNLYDHPNAYVLSNLFVSCLLQAGWSAFAALTVHRFVAGVSVWVVVLLYVVVVLSCLVAFLAVTSFYQGQIYKLVVLPLGLASLIVFRVWPAMGHAIYGWFFALF